jgi:hypothetical protein
LIVEAKEETSIREGSVRAGQTHALSKQQWCLIIKAIVEKESGRFPPSSRRTGALMRREQGVQINGARWKAWKGAIMLFDDQILQPHGAGAIAVIIITDIPDNIGINSNYVELLTQAAGHQLACVLEHSPRIEMDGDGIIKHAVKDACKHAQRSRDAQTMAAMYRTIRKVGYLNPKLARENTSAHPEKHDRSPSQFNSKEAARIYGTDLFADIGDGRNAQAKVEWGAQI